MGMPTSHHPQRAIPLSSGHHVQARNILPVNGTSYQCRYDRKSLTSSIFAQLHGSGYADEGSPYASQKSCARPWAQLQAIRC